MSNLNLTQNEYFDHFFDEEEQSKFEHLEEISNGELIAMLDDLVQVLVLEDTNRWAFCNDKAHRAFRKLKYEIMGRLKEEYDRERE